MKYGINKMITTKKKPKYRSAFTLVEMILAIGIVSVIGLAITGMVYASYQSWELSSRRSDVLQNGQAAMEQMIRILRQAKELELTAISDPCDSAGFLTFTAVDDTTKEFRLNTSTSELEYGEPGSLSALTGPMNSLSFMCYDLWGDLLENPLDPCDPRDVGNIRSIIIQAEFASEEYPSLTFSLSGRVFIPTDLNTSRLMGWWKLDETSGITASDSSGNWYDGTLTNMVGNEWTTGMLGRALHFDGLNDYIDIDLEGAEVDTLTFSAWFKSPDPSSVPDDDTAQRFLSQPRSSTETRMALGLNRGKIAVSWFDGTYNVREGTTNLSAGAWYHAAVTYDGSNVRLYLDGIQDGPVFPESSMVSGSYDNFVIAQDIEGLRLFEGMLDDVRVYSHSLSAEEIADLALVNMLRYRVFAEAKAETDTTSIIIDTPGGTSPDDLLIVAVATDGDTSSSLTPPDGEGWTRINIGVYSSNVTLGAWWKNAGVSESASHEFTWSDPEQAYGWIMRFTGHDPTTPISDWAGDGGLSSTPISSAVTTTDDYALILRLGAFDDDDITVDSPGLSGHVAITMDSSTTGTTGAVSGGAGYIQQLSSGDSGTSSFSLTGSEESRTLTIAISPAP